MRMSSRAAWFFHWAHTGSPTPPGASEPVELAWRVALLQGHSTALAINRAWPRPEAGQFWPERWGHQPRDP